MKNDQNIAGYGNNGHLVEVQSLANIEEGQYVGDHAGTVAD